jgi:hypothetical protein
MRYLKRQNINRRVANDTTLYSDVANANVFIAPVNGGSVVIPNGSSSQVPSSPQVGMMRYNATTNEVEVYQGSGGSATWRAIRYKESTGITQQNLGVGDSSQVYFGPLNPAPPTVVQTGNGSSSGQYSTNVAWGGQNIIVLIENLMQLNNVNYTVVQNPSIGTDSSAIGTLSFAGSTGSKILYFNTSANVISASWSTNVATLTFASTYTDQTGSSKTRSEPPFAIGATITVTGMIPTGYNGIYTVTGSTATSITYALSSNPGSATVYGGTVTASGTTPAVFASLNNLIGANVTGTGIAGSSTVASYSVDTGTDALVSITMNNYPSSTIAINTVNITISEGATTGSGWYLKFSSPPPYGKIVTALIGFDQ